MPEKDRFEKVAEKVQKTLEGYPCLNEIVGDELIPKVKENRQKYHATKNILFHMLLSARSESFTGGGEEIEQLEHALKIVTPSSISQELVSSIGEGLLSYLEAEQTTTISILLAMSYFKERGYEIMSQGDPIFEATRGDRRFHVETYALPASPYMEERLIDPEEAPPEDVLSETIPWLTEQLLELDKTPCPEDASVAIFLQIFDNLTGDVKRDERIVKDASTEYFSMGGRASVIIYCHFLLKNAVELHSTPNAPGV